MRKLKLYGLIAAAGLSAALMTGCGGNGGSKETATETSADETAEEETAADNTETKETEDTETNGDIIGMPNPFKDCGSLEEAEKTAGFSFECPVFDDLENKTYQAIEDSMIQVFNSGEGAEDGGYILVRKALKDGSEGESKSASSESESVSAESESVEKNAAEDAGIADISGDYNNYDVEETMEINGITVIARGNAADAYSVVIWNDGDYAYAIDMTDLTIPAALIETYVPMIK